MLAWIYWWSETAGLRALDQQTECNELCVWHNQLVFPAGRREPEPIELAQTNWTQFAHVGLCPGLPFPAPKQKPTFPAVRNNHVQCTVSRAEPIKAKPLNVYEAVRREANRGYVVYLGQSHANVFSILSLACFVLRAIARDLNQCIYYVLFVLRINVIYCTVHRVARDVAKRNGTSELRWGASIGAEGMGGVATQNSGGMGCEAPRNFKCACIIVLHTADVLLVCASDVSENYRCVQCIPSEIKPCRTCMHVKNKIRWKFTPYKNIRYEKFTPYLFIRCEFLTPYVFIRCEFLTPYVFIRCEFPTPYVFTRCEILTPYVL